MFTVREIRIASNALGNFLKAKPDLAVGTRHLAKIQPRRAEFWRQVSQQVENGKMLSDQLVGHWPEDCLQPLKVGERSGNLATILIDIREACKYSERVQKLMMGLLQPAIYIVLAIAIGLGFAGFVIPAVSSMFSNGDSVVGKWGEAIHLFVSKAWPVMLAGVAGGGWYLVMWLRSPENRLTLVGWALSIPLIGRGLSNLIFAKWARFMSLLHAAGGVDLWDMLRLTAPIIPMRLRSPFLMAASLLEKGQSMQRVFGEGTPIFRDVDIRLIPDQIVIAFVVGSESGNLDEQLRIAASVLDDDGKELLEMGIEVTKTITMVVASVCAIAPMVLYFLQMLNALAESAKAL
jgi:type II secretory pathway component PulF